MANIIVEHSELSTPHLLAHLVSRHRELKGALPPVRSLAAKVSAVHGEHNPRLRELAAAVDALAEILVPHLEAEEQRLFPALSAGDPDRALIAQEFEAMVAHHQQVATLLASARVAAEDFTVPQWGCRSYRALFAELEQLERQVITQMHLENHVLKPRFAPS